MLAPTFPAHWYFFAEAEGTRSAQADYGKVKEVRASAFAVMHGVCGFQ